MEPMYYKIDGYYLQMLAKAIQALEEEPLHFYKVPPPDWYVAAQKELEAMGTRLREMIAERITQKYAYPAGELRERQSKTTSQMRFLLDEGKEEEGEG